MNHIVETNFLQLLPFNEIVRDWIYKKITIKFNLFDCQVDPKIN